MNYEKKYLKYKRKYLQAKNNQKGGYFVLFKDKIHYISNERSATRKDTLLVMSFRDFLNQRIFQLLNLSTAYFEAYSDGFRLKDPDAIALEQKMISGVIAYLKAISPTASDSDFSGDIYIYIADKDLLSRFLEVKTDKSFKQISKVEYRWS